ncbi:uncharacterized protein LOC104584189 [Brachypodium distachyon]|uniref:uncharacterized protein LOC104584189 n=1 Tax=Brachypodium distachyon TaxID=15368 RepID=UPI00052FFD4D|nr:uncharacterized protein LOC104584189 [Brachypodium distachyon]|eukprot:XP_010236662.1 uncharacterized protein LOC104584189 [Brachypodium distachyon]
MLTRTNYADWAILVRVQLQGAGLWEAVEGLETSRRQEREACSAILRSVPLDMMRVIAAKAWEAVKLRRAGVEHVREVKAQKLRKGVGDDITEEKTVKKLLRLVPARIKPVALAMESCLDFSNMSIEELSGRLSAAEDGLDPKPEVGSKLLLVEEEWRQRSHGSNSGGSSDKNGRSPVKANSPVATEKSGGGGAGGSGEKKKGSCWYCGKPSDEDKRGSGESHFWQSVMGVNQIFQNCTQRIVGDGAKTQFWEDVKDKGTDFIKFRRTMYGETEDCWQEIVELVDKTTLSSEPDTAGALVDYRGVWNLKIPLKIKIFTWLAVRNSILTKDNLLRRGALLPDRNKQKKAGGRERDDQTGHD